MRHAVQIALLGLLLIVDARIYFPRHKRQAESTSKNPLSFPDFTSFNADQTLGDKVKLM